MIFKQPYLFQFLPQLFLNVHKQNYTTQMVYLETALRLRLNKGYP